MLSVQAPAVPKTSFLLSPGAACAPGDGEYKQPLGTTGSTDPKGQSPEVGAKLTSYGSGRSVSRWALTHHLDSCTLLLL